MPSRERHGLGLGDVETPYANMAGLSPSSPTPATAPTCAIGLTSRTPQRSRTRSSGVSLRLPRPILTGQSLEDKLAQSKTQLGRSPVGWTTSLTGDWLVHGVTRLYQKQGFRRLFPHLSGRSPYF